MLGVWNAIENQKFDKAKPQQHWSTAYSCVLCWLLEISTSEMGVNIIGTSDDISFW